MRFLLALLAIAACDKGPIQEHRIHYEKYFFEKMWLIDVDLDKRTLVAYDDAHKLTSAALTAADAKQLADVAGCAREEAPGPRSGAMDMSEQIVLDGDLRKAITQSGPMTAACAAKLEIRIETLAGWR